MVAPQKKFSDVESHVDFEYGSWTPDSNDDTSRRVKVSDTVDVKSVGDYFLDVSDGEYSGQQRLSISGYASDIDRSDGLIEVWDGGISFPYKTVNAQLDVSSNSNNDTLTGVGGRTLSIVGVDEDYNLVSEEIDMDGTNTVTTVNSYIFVNKATFLIAGSANTNTGDISIKHTGDEIALMRPQQGATLHSIYYVPTGSSLFVYSIFNDLNRGDGSSGLKEGQIFIQSKEFGKAFVTTAPQGLRSDGAGGRVALNFPVKFPEKSIVRVMFTARDNGCLVSSRVEALLKENE